MSSHESSNLTLPPIIDISLETLYYQIKSKNKIQFCFYRRPNNEPLLHNDNQRHGSNDNVQMSKAKDLSHFSQVKLADSMIAKRTRGSGLFKAPILWLLFAIVTAQSKYPFLFSTEKQIHHEDTPSTMFNAIIHQQEMISSLENLYFLIDLFINSLIDF